MTWSASVVFEFLAFIFAVPTSILALFSLYKLFRGRFGNFPYASPNYIPGPRHAVPPTPITVEQFTGAWHFRTYQATSATSSSSYIPLDNRFSEMV
ncbi:hypothetical protein BDV59DRAFT_171015 [Aspergillus ambiguus]|uniref:uncharacterized protein n=1 Tax=Aspergillus ambiguus TaxID=176160 RepID=UPI003CCCED6E